MTTVPAHRPRAGSQAISSRWQTVLLYTVVATVAANVANVALLVFGKAAGASYVVPDPNKAGATVEVQPVDVIMATTLPLVVGAVVATAAAAFVYARWPPCSPCCR